MDYYTHDEWQNAIASLGRLVDIRNCPDAAADILLGRTPAYLGFGSERRGLPKGKAIDPKVPGALVLWTKGPVRILKDHPGMRKVRP